MEIQLGQIYCLKTESEIAHPHIVVDVKESIATVLGITTNMKKLSMPGIFVLEAGEGGLEKQSIVETYKSFVVKQSDLTEYIGKIDLEKLNSIINSKIAQ